MPRKNIYVKDADLEVFERAEKLADDNLSAVIAEAIRRYVEAKEDEAQGLQPYTLSVGSREDRKNVKFSGRLLSAFRKPLGSSASEAWSIYQTRAGKIIIFMSFEDYSGEYEDCSFYEVLEMLPVYDYKVFKDKEKIPDGLITQAHESLGREVVEFIE